jgi:Protein of unknown function (DUF559)
MFPRPHPSTGRAARPFPVPAASRTIVDLAGAVGEHSLRGTVEQAAVLGLLDIPAIDNILETGARRRQSRPPRDPEQLAGPSRSAPFPEPPGGKGRVQACRSGRSPAADKSQDECGGRNIEVDLIWPQQLLVVEADGRKTHDTAAAFERDRRRHRDLFAAGYRVLRVTWTQLEDEPERTLNTIARLVRGQPVRQPEEQRARDPSPVPLFLTHLMRG